MKQEKSKIVVLTGAGMSAESGVSTFRDAKGLWENHDIMEVASPQGWNHNPNLVLEFYNQRRRQLKTVEPNAAHQFLADLEQYCEVDIITQNVDNLHERAGSTSVLHLHGQLNQVRSEKNEHLVYTWTDDLQLGDLAEDNYQLRPHIVWFGEQVPAMEQAIEICKKAEVLIIIGTSLSVYPAASLFEYTTANTPIVLINPEEQKLLINQNRPLFNIQKTACEGIENLRNVLVQLNLH